MKSEATVLLLLVLLLAGAVFILTGLSLYHEAQHLTHALDAALAQNP